MARLRRAAKDGHLYILAGQSQGTWQVSEKGESWLRQNLYRIPGQDEDVYLDAGTYSFLKDKGYLYILFRPYDHSRQDTQSDTQEELEPVVEGLPLLLRLKENKKPAWDLVLDLTELSEDAWEELKSHPTDFVTASSALTSISQKQLNYTHYLLSVYPSLLPYQIYRENSGHLKQVLKHAPETPGLISTWQGNIFIERPHQAGIWRRRLPGSAVSFAGELLWLAKSDCEPEWPGKTERIGAIYSGWQLWRMSVDENAPALWESLQRWFNYRAIYLTAQRQHLEIISPPTAIRDDGRYIIQPGKSVWMACNPPSKQVEGISRQITLSAMRINDTARDTGLSSESITSPFPADRVSYFRWTTTNPGDYRIRIQGDASAEPLLIRVATLSPPQPHWLHGLTCTVSSTQSQQILHALNNILHTDAKQEAYQLNQFTIRELPMLSWTYAPENLPIRVIWNDVSSNVMRRPRRVCTIQSGDELTRCWREQVCPTLATSLETKVTLDAGSFGCIELLIALPQPHQKEKERWIDERLKAQFIWLSRVMQAKQSQKCIPIPASLRDTIRQLSLKADTNPLFFAALERFTIADTVPAWILFRLQTLVAEVENLEAIGSPKQGR